VARLHHPLCPRQGDCSRVPSRQSHATPGGRSDWLRQGKRIRKRSTADSSPSILSPRAQRLVEVVASVELRHGSRPAHGRRRGRGGGLTAGCNEVDPSGLLFGVTHLRRTVIFRVGLLKRHPCAGRRHGPISLQSAVRALLDTYGAEACASSARWQALASR
jgi:hypothetical protein